MLAIVAADGHYIPLDCDDYCIVHNWNGWEDEVKFSLPRGHPQMRLLTERVRLVEKTEDQTYALSSINGGAAPPTTRPCWIWTACAAPC